MLPPIPSGLKRRSRALLLAIAFLALASPGSAQLGQPPVARPDPAQATAELNAALVAINTQFNATLTMRGEFIQVGPDASTLSEGVFFMARPGKVRFEYYPPSQLLIISNGTTLLIENRATRTRDRYPLARTPLAPLLAAYTDLTAPGNVQSIRYEEDMVAVLLVAAEDGSSLTLFFDRASLNLRQWRTLDPQGNQVTFVIYNLSVNQALDEGLFQFLDRV